MLLRSAGMRRSKLNILLAVLAVIGVFAAFDVIGHRDTPYFWAKLISVLAFSAGCLVLTREREAVDTFSAVVAALFTLCAIAMTTGDRASPNWWPFFLGFIGATVVLVFLTRKKRETLLAIAAIVGLRLIVFVILYVLQR
jgi:peptidoglycan/LPS O-acetylase OafA/YrhL